jgi:4'-phosphopantetheinyl transferase
MPIDDSAQSHRLQLWFSRVSEETLAAEDEVRAWLSASERERLQRIRHEGKSREYLLSRALMRHALSQQFQRSEASWQISGNSGEAPVIEDLPTGTHLSLSHSHGYQCFALASCRLGIDIEVINPDRDFLASAEMFMNTAERECLQGNAVAPADFFYRAWCAKEACYKSLTPEEQIATTMQAISYTALRDGAARRRLIEGESAGFRFAAAMAYSPETIEQHCYKIPVAVRLESPNREQDPG